MYSTHEKDNLVDADQIDEADDAALPDDASPDSSMLTTMATIGVVGVGVAVLEAALLPGVVLGVAAVAAPKYLPRLGSAMAPLFRSAVRGVYMAGRKTREIVAEAQEQVNDIVAEVDSETDHSVDTDAHAEVKKS
jgi:hypothetical protein